MLERYNRISIVEREEINFQLAIGSSYRAIARQLGRSPSTISREFCRNAITAGYRAAAAQRKVDKRCYRKPQKLVPISSLRHYVLWGLRQQWSSQQISARIKERYPDDETMRVSAEKIYTYLYVLPRGELRRELLCHLRQHHKKRRPRSRGEDHRGQIPEMISIDERPPDVAEKIVPGHLVERTTRTTLLVPLKAKDAASVRKTFARRLRAIPRQMKLSMTYD